MDLHTSASMIKRTSKTTGVASQSKYKIRQIPTGLYSDGRGQRARFSKNGKTWNMLSHIKAHMKTMTYDPFYTEVVCFEMVETDILPMHELLKELDTKKHEKEVAKLQRQLESLKQQLINNPSKNEKYLTWLSTKIVGIEEDIKNVC